MSGRSESDGRRTINTNIRLNLNREEDRRAWDYLQSMDRKEFHSYSRAVVAALNNFFGRREQLEADPFLETRQKEDAFLEKVLSTIREGIAENLSQVQVVHSAAASSEHAEVETAEAMKDEGTGTTNPQSWDDISAFLDNF